ncbi:MAG: DUF1259 domain-containing protein [Candidatus Acidiferrales bacterium]
MRSIQRLSLLLSLLLLPLIAAAQGLNTAKIDQVLGRSGNKTGEVYKVGFPRTDLHVVVHGVAIKPGLALGSWAAFSGTDENATVMGDLVLLQGEVNPVMEKLRAVGFEVTAVHNHLLNETPRIMYMHYMGRGAAEQLARSLRGALAVSKTPLGKPAAAPATSATPPAWVKTVEDTIARKGTYQAGVFSLGVPRANSVTMDGMTITPAEGVAESINFQSAGTGNVATTGDFVLIASEVNPVISALQEHHIFVTALHSHMLTEQPRLFFMHFWAEGKPEAVAAGIKAALEKISVK